MEEQLTVAEIARRTGVAVSHVRYYERAGLLPVPQRMGRQVRYPVSVVERLNLIGAAREAGLSLAEIRELSELRGLRLDRPRPRVPVRAMERPRAPR